MGVGCQAVLWLGFWGLDRRKKSLHKFSTQEKKTSARRVSQLRVLTSYETSACALARLSTLLRGGAYTYMAVIVWLSRSPVIQSLVNHQIERIEKSHLRGETCAIYAEIEKSSVGSNPAAAKDSNNTGVTRIPRVFPRTTRWHVSVQQGNKHKLQRAKRSFPSSPR